MMENYEYIDHTADIGVKAWGDDISRAFETAAFATFNIITDAGSIQNELSREINLEADDMGQLLVDWLSELLYILEVEGILFSEFEVSLETDGEVKKLAATARGEPMDLKKHPLKSEIKAVTYHMLEVNLDENYVVVLFDL